MPDAAVERLRYIAGNGTPEDRERAVMHLDESNVPLSEGAVPPELAGEAEVPAPQDPAGEAVASAPPPSPEPKGQSGTALAAPKEVREERPEEQAKEEEVTAFGVLLDVVDIVTDFVPVISEGKAAYHAYELSKKLNDAMERGDEAAVLQLSADLALTMTDLLPGPNIAGTIRKIGSRADRIPLVNALKEKLQRLLSKAKQPDGLDAKPGGASTARSDTSGGGPETPEPNKPAPRNEPDKGEGPARKNDEGRAESQIEPWDVPKEVTEKFPQSWGSGAPTKMARRNPAKAGLRWHDPSGEGSGVRIDKGILGSRFPSQRVDHVIVNYRGKVIGRNGTPIKGAINDHAVEAHIPLSEYRTWKFWFKP